MRSRMLEQAVSILQERTSALAQTVRTLSHELHPSVLQHSGLVATLRHHCAEVAHHHQLEIGFSAGGNLDSLSPDVALCLFRVAQEALTNAVRHARAQTIDVRLSTTTEGVELAVVDDGVGFVAGERARSGLGLRSIDERVRLTQGSVRVESQPGFGTRLLVQIPAAMLEAGIVAPSEASRPLRSFTDRYPRTFRTLSPVLSLYPRAGTAARLRGPVSEHPCTAHESCSPTTTRRRLNCSACCCGRSSTSSRSSRMAAPSSAPQSSCPRRHRRRRLDAHLRRHRGRGVDLSP